MKGQITKFGLDGEEGPNAAWLRLYGYEGLNMQLRLNMEEGPNSTRIGLYGYEAPNSYYRDWKKITESPSFFIHS